MCFFFFCNIFVRILNFFAFGLFLRDRLGFSGFVVFYQNLEVLGHGSCSVWLRERWEKKII
jgi:hypothetical protein